MGCLSSPCLILEQVSFIQGRRPDLEHQISTERGCAIDHTRTCSRILIILTREQPRGGGVVVVDGALVQQRMHHLCTRLLDCTHTAASWQLGWCRISFVAHREPRRCARAGLDTHVLEASLEEGRDDRRRQRHTLLTGLCLFWYACGMRGHQ
jgi:hypothetical protein